MVVMFKLFTSVSGAVGRGWLKEISEEKRVHLTASFFNQQRNTSRESFQIQGKAGKLFSYVSEKQHYKTKACLCWDQS